MRKQVSARDLVVGDVVLLPTEFGEQELLITQRIPRAASIKFVGTSRAQRAHHAGSTQWGWPPDQLVTRVRRAR